MNTIKALIRGFFSFVETIDASSYLRIGYNGIETKRLRIMRTKKLTKG